MDGNSSSGGDSGAPSRPCPRSMRLATSARRAAISAWASARSVDESAIGIPPFQTHSSCLETPQSGDKRQRPCMLYPRRELRRVPNRMVHETQGQVRLHWMKNTRLDGDGVGFWEGGAD